MTQNQTSAPCYCDALEVGILCATCETEFFGFEIEEIELDEVW